MGIFGRRDKPIRRAATQLGGRVEVSRARGSQCTSEIVGVLPAAEVALTHGGGRGG